MVNKIPIVLAAVLLVCAPAKAAAGDPPVDAQIIQLRRQIDEEKDGLRSLIQKHDRLMADAAPAASSDPGRNSVGGNPAGRAPLEIELNKVQLQALHKQRAMVRRQLQELFSERVVLERKKLALEERKLRSLLAYRDQQRRAGKTVKPKPKTRKFSLPAADPTADRLGAELDMMLEKQGRLMQEGLTLEKEMQKATER